MNHEESKLQKQCVAWFRAQYPQYAMLLTHVANEGNGNRVSAAIHKGEGTVAGVPDLLLFMPAVFDTGDLQGVACHGLGIEMKTAKGKQSQQQKDFQKIFESALYQYVVVRSFEEFKKCVRDYISRTTPYTRAQISAAHVEVENERLEREREKLRKIVKKG